MTGKARFAGLTLVATAAVTLAVVWPLGGSAAPAKTLASGSYTDASGDSSNGPDLTTIQVSDDGTKISFAATIANRSQLTDVDAIQAFFDTDRNTGTGGLGGIDYEVAFIDGHEELEKWDGSQFATVSPAPASFSASYKNGVGSFSIDKADFGNSLAFDFVVTTTGDGGDSTADRAPNTGIYGYPSASTSPPPPPGSPPPGPPPPGSPPPPPSGVTLIGTGFTVGKPHAGKSLTAAMVVRVKQTGIAVKTTVTCTAKVAGRTAKVTKKGSVFSGRASCTWKLPPNTKGKQVKGSMTATYQGAKVTKTFTRIVQR